MSWPARASGSGSAESGLSLGLGLGGAKVMLNSREEEEEEVEREQVMRGSVRMGMRESEGLEKSEEESEDQPTYEKSSQSHDVHLSNTKEP